MNAYRRKQVVLLLLVVVIAGLMAVMAGGAAAKGGPPNPPVLPPNSSAFGMTYEEWAAKYWQWAFALPGDETHPFNAEGVMDCSLGQQGNVWFLAYPGGGWPAGTISQERECEIPVGNALFFPVVNLVCTTYEDGDTVEDLIGCANFISDFNYPLSVKIDGRDVPNLESYEIISVPFNIGPLPDPNMYGWPVGWEGLGVSPGYYLLMPPLSKGDHTVEFSGQVYAPDFGVDWTFDVLYKLDVVTDID